MKMCHRPKSSKSPLAVADSDCHVGLHAVTHPFCYARGTIGIVFLLIIPLANAQPLSFNYTDFSQAHYHDLNLQGDANYSQSGGIQLAGSTKSPDKASGFGRVTTSNPINLLDQNSKKRYDFTTSFSFVISSDNQSYDGDGLTFFLASASLPIGHDISGGGLGLVNPYRPLPNEYSFVAVEFDTFQNEWDPKGPHPHVGVDANSVVSIIHQEWTADFSEKGKVYNCSITYNSIINHLDVFFGDTFSGLAAQHFTWHVDLRDYLGDDSVIVGISAASATGNNSVELSLLSWSFSTTLPMLSNANPKKERNPTFMEGLGIGIGLSVSLLVLVLVLILIWKRGKRKDDSTSDLMDREFQTGTGPQRISYHKLVSATSNFEEAKKLGKGGFGGVYKGYFEDTDSYAAIKKISADSRQGMKEYAAEVKTISQLRHRNLVQLIGWCHKKNDLLLIYEYMPNGSLHSCLFDGVSFLSWQVRYNIALGLASALLYLQEGWEKCVLHRDIKSSNIMLDSNFNAKLGDFGLARLVDHEKGSRTTVTAGTMGYIAPEYMKTGKVRKESDIYSFGVVLLEIASGKKAIHHKEMEGRVTQVSLVEWVWELYGLRNLLAAADPNLCGVFDVQQMECLVVVGLWCAHPDCRCRPSIGQVIKVLKFDASIPILPQRMPLLAHLPPITTELFFTVPSSFQATSQVEINRM